MGENRTWQVEGKQGAGLSHATHGYSFAPAFGLGSWGMVVNLSLLRLHLYFVFRVHQISSFMGKKRTSFCSKNDGLITLNCFLGSRWILAVHRRSAPARGHRSVALDGKTSTPGDPQSMRKQQSAKKWHHVPVRGRFRVPLSYIHLPLSTTPRK